MNTNQTRTFYSDEDVDLSTNDRKATMVLRTSPDSREQGKKIQIEILPYGNQRKISTELDWARQTIEKYTSDEKITPETARKAISALDEHFPHPRDQYEQERKKVLAGRTNAEMILTAIINPETHSKIPTQGVLIVRGKGSEMIEIPIIGENLSNQYCSAYRTLFELSKVKLIGRDLFGKARMMIHETFGKPSSAYAKNTEGNKGLDDLAKDIGGI